MVTADARCQDPRCNDKNIYRMVGACSNCRTNNILILYTARHEAYQTDCPICGNKTVRPQRLAAEDEIPVA